MLQASVKASEVKPTGRRRTLASPGQAEGQGEDQGPQEHCLGSAHHMAVQGHLAEAAAGDGVGPSLAAPRQARDAAVEQRQEHWAAWKAAPGRVDTHLKHQHIPLTLAFCQKGLRKMSKEHASNFMQLS